VTADYNGWTDSPEDEREALDAWEARGLIPAPLTLFRFAISYGLHYARYAYDATNTAPATPGQEG
jgi:hypothetical protein